MAEAAFVKVAEVGELSPGEMKMVEVGENQILLANVVGTRRSAHRRALLPLMPHLGGGGTSPTIQVLSMRPKWLWRR